MRQLTQLLLAAALWLASGPALHAQSADATKPGDDRLHDTLRFMQDEIQKLRNENQSMRDQIDELRARTEDNWLTEARADQIRALVQDVLADADTRSNLLNDGLMAGWSDHFFLADAFGRFLLEFEGLIQFRWMYNYRFSANPTPDKNRSGFENTRTRLTFRGHVFSEDLQYLVRGEFARHAIEGAVGGVLYLYEAWLRYHLDNNWSVRAGQFKLPFMREELVYEAAQLAVEHSLMNEIMSIGRSQGIELAYHDSANSFSLVFSDGTTPRGRLLGGLLPPTAANRGALASDTEYALTARFERLLAGTWNQFADFTSPVDEEFGMLLGLAAHIQQGESTETPFVGDNEARGLGVTGDFSVEWGGANAFVAVTYHYIDHPSFDITHLLGVVGQIGVYVAPKWEVFVRGEWVQVDTRTPVFFRGPDMGIGTVGFNYYIEGHDVKWTTDFGFSLTPISGVWIFGGEDTELAGFTGWRALNTHNPQVLLRTQIQVAY